MKTNRSRMALIAAFAGIFFAFPLFLAEARPKYMKIFNEDATTKTEYHDQCNVCHVSRLGGGERTYFGDAFDENNDKITPEMRAKYPKYFKAESPQN